MGAASIRCYVPEFFNGQDSKTSYEIYLQMPPGLPKMRYETEAWKWCQPMINTLRTRGVVKLQDALPLSKFVMYLKSVDTPKPLMNMCLDMVVALKRMGPRLPAGLSHEESMKRNEEIKNGEGTVTQARKALETVRPQPSPPRSPPPPPPPPKFEELSEEARKDAKLPGKLLVNMVEGRSWSNLHAPIEDLFTHAAFLVCPHVNEAGVTKDGKKEEVETDMGHISFKAFVKSLQEAETENDRRELTRVRYRAALIMATPYCLRLKADGTHTVQDLINVNLPDVKMPPMLQAQVEACISVAVAGATNSKVVPTVRNHLSTNKEQFTISMTYDPRFQRGPWDPYGRAPRLEGLKKLVPIKTEDPPQVAEEASALAAMPGTLWDKAKKVDPLAGFNETTKKLWHFQPKETSDHGGHHHHHRRAAGGQGASTDGGGTQSGTLNGGGSNTATNTHSASGYLPSDGVVGYDSQDLDATLESNAGMVKSIKSVDEVFTGKGRGHRAKFAAASLEEQAEMLKKPDLKGKTEKQIWDEEAEKRRLLFSRDFQVRVMTGFERPYVCRYPGCRMQFSRAYTMKVHEKSHTLFSNYHKFKKQPQLFLDGDSAALKEERQAREVASWSLPPLVQGDLDQLTHMASLHATTLVNQMDDSFDDWGDWGGGESWEVGGLPRKVAVGGEG